MRLIKLIGFCVILGSMHQTVNAQKDEFGVWTSIHVKKKLGKGWTVFAEGEYRTRDNLKTTDRWAGGVGADYRLFPFLKIGGGYTYLYCNHPEEVTKKGNIIPAYWSRRHRTNVSLTGRVAWNRFTFSLRERWQYTYRPEQYVPKYDDDGVTPKDDELVKGKGKNVLRSRLQAEYNIARCRFTPFASCELYHGSGGLDKTRWTAGSEYKINKRNVLEVYYRYQNKHDDDETNGHVLGIGYTIKF